MEAGGETHRSMARTSLKAPCRSGSLENQSSIFGSPPTIWRHFFTEPIISTPQRFIFDESAIRSARRYHGSGFDQRAVRTIRQPNPGGLGRRSHQDRAADGRHLALQRSVPQSRHDRTIHGGEQKQAQPGAGSQAAGRQVRIAATSFSGGVSSSSMPLPSTMPRSTPSVSVQ